MPDTPPARACIRCDAPLPPHAKAYCAACRLERARQGNIEAQRKRRQKKRAARAAMRQKPAAEPAPASGTWTDADVVRCMGCKYWRPLGYYGPAFHYPIDTGRLRPCRPCDCYGHVGTPYTPKR